MTMYNCPGCSQWHTKKGMCDRCLLTNADEGNEITYKLGDILTWKSNRRGTKYVISDINGSWYTLCSLDGTVKNWKLKKIEWFEPVQEGES